MKTDSADYRQQHTFRPINTYSHLRLSEVTSLQEVLDCLATLRREQPEFRFLCTLDDIGQCCYTSGHASMDDRLYLDGDVDFDDPEAVHAWEGKGLAHVAAQLQSGLQQTWSDVVGELEITDEGIDALLAMNRNADAVLDDVVYVQRLPVARDDLLIAGLPNGYFSCDWDVFQNHAVIRHLQEKHAYRFFGMGAAWLGFIRDQPIESSDAESLVADLRQLYGQHKPAHNETAWREFSQVIQQQEVLLLGYIENFAE